MHHVNGQDVIKLLAYLNGSLTKISSKYTNLTEKSDCQRFVSLKGENYGPTRDQTVQTDGNINIKRVDVCHKRGNT